MTRAGGDKDALTVSNVDAGWETDKAGADQDDDADAGDRSDANTADVTAEARELAAREQQSTPPAALASVAETADEFDDPTFVAAVPPDLLAAARGGPVKPATAPPSPPPVPDRDRDRGPAGDSDRDLAAPDFAPAPRLRLGPYALPPPRTLWIAALAAVGVVAIATLLWTC